ncbi:redoxin domain-containing protein [Maricaulis alexandrii]|uniref:redoxin domain-containing protein n=1 Tax=Maricaulis alexandrii TaxID=2570354 RepID=UPI0011097FDB|nr:redoxin domain-containing protein [Maricaulis alexandrii]
MSAHSQISVINRSAPFLAAFRNQLDVGDYAPDFDALTPLGHRIRLFDDAFAGRPILLVFLGDLDRPDVSEAFTALAQMEPRIEQSGAHLVIVTSHTDGPRQRALSRERGLHAPILGDCNGALFARYGLVRGQDLHGETCARSFLITAHGQIHSISDQPRTPLEDIMDALQDLTSGQTAQTGAGWIPGHAPILIIPKAFEAEDCATLIEHFNTSDGFRVAKPGPGESGDYKFPVSDYNRQDRIDHVIQDKALLARLDKRINDRVLPQIAKAFAFQVTRRETLHIARYSGPRQGIEIGHRDNTNPATQYRRFALSVALNDDYEGGGLVFREFSDRGYRGEPGTAFVFSSSLLHEIEETTAGVRYNLISHFFNDAAAQPQRR